MAREAHSSEWQALTGIQEGWCACGKQRIYAMSCSLMRWVRLRQQCKDVPRLADCCKEDNQPKAHDNHKWKTLIQERNLRKKHEVTKHKHENFEVTQEHDYLALTPLLPYIVMKYLYRSIKPDSQKRLSHSQEVLKCRWGNHMLCQVWLSQARPIRELWKLVLSHHRTTKVNCKKQNRRTWIAP